MFGKSKSCWIATMQLVFGDFISGAASYYIALVLHFERFVIPRNNLGDICIR